MKTYRAGYTSIMIDGSHEDFEENIHLTKSVVDACHPGNVPVEGESVINQKLIYSICIRKAILYVPSRIDSKILTLNKKKKSYRTQDAVALLLLVYVCKVVRCQIKLVDTCPSRSDSKRDAGNRTAANFSSSSGVMDRPLREMAPTGCI